MRTIIYVDGYNLYYSMLTKTKHKWVDIHKLFTHCIVKTIEPKSDVICLKYFTSPIKANYCSDPEAPNRQRKYHNALARISRERLGPKIYLLNASVDSQVAVFFSEIRLKNDLPPCSGRNFP